MRLPPAECRDSLKRFLTVALGRPVEGLGLRCR